MVCVNLNCLLFVFECIKCRLIKEEVCVCVRTWSLMKELCVWYLFETIIGSGFYCTLETHLEPLIICKIVLKCYFLANFSTLFFW